MLILIYPSYSYNFHSLPTPLSFVSRYSLIVIIWTITLYTTIMIPSSQGSIVIYHPYSYNLLSLPSFILITHFIPQNHFMSNPLYYNLDPLKSRLGRYLSPLMLIISNSYPLILHFSFFIIILTGTLYFQWLLSLLFDEILY